MAMEKVEKAIEAGDTEGAREKMTEEAIVSMDKPRPATRVMEMSEGEAVRGEEEEPLEGRGG